MKTTDLKTIDIKTLVWFDKVNGNSYFAQTITLNFGMEKHGGAENKGFRSIKKNVQTIKQIKKFNH